MDCVEVIVDPIDELRKKQYNEDKGHEDILGNVAEKFVGKTLDFIRKKHSESQLVKANQKEEYESDSDSETDFSNVIRDIAKEEVVWFKGCGCNLTIETSIFFTQVFVGVTVIIYCFIQLWHTTDSETLSAYLPVLTGIIGYFLPSYSFPKKKKK